MGPMRFFFFYLLCGIAAGLVHWLTNSNSTLPTLGASGAIAGVMGAYFVLFPRSRVIVMVPLLFIPFFFDFPAMVYLGYWALMQLFSGTLAVGSPGDAGGVAWWAHVGGFLSGAVLQLFFVKGRDGIRPLSPDEYRTENAWLPARHWRSVR